MIIDQLLEAGVSFTPVTGLKTTEPKTMSRRQACSGAWGESSRAPAAAASPEASNGSKAVEVCKRPYTIS